MKKKYVVSRTHGGLGNQLFQILYGRLLAKQKGLQLRELHDSNYLHAFARSGKLICGRELSSWQKLFSAARIPKVINLIPCCGEAPVGFWDTIYLDGYFQNVTNYTKFDFLDIEQVLNSFRNEIGIRSPTVNSTLEHLRLGDFFVDQAGAISHTLERLRNIPQGTHIMTNEEKLLRHDKIKDLINTKELTLVKTQDMTAEEVLKTMSRYRRINGNESTLTFWASVLAGCKVNFKNENLRQLQEYLKIKITI